MGRIQIQFINGDAKVEFGTKKSFVDNILSKILIKGKFQVWTNEDD